MTFKNIQRIILFYILTQVEICQASFDVHQVLSSEAIANITSQKNYFNRHNAETLPNSVWSIGDLEYSEFFYKKRPEVIEIETALSSSMERSVELAINLQSLTQSRLDIHISAGKLLPSLNLPFGEGVDYGISSLFKGIFGFILPEHWLRLKNSKTNYDIAKLSLLKEALDQYAGNRQILYEIHRKVVQFEIESFYFVHLQLLAENLTENSEIKATLLSLSRGIATSLAYTGNFLGIRFNDLAYIGNIFRDEAKNIAANSIRLDFNREYLEPLSELSEMGSAYESREKFVRASLERSIEMMIIKNLAKISKLNIGISAFGSVSTKDNDNDFQALFELGYGTIPAILKAHANQKIATIEVGAELRKFLDQSRRAYGNYQNALRLRNNAMTAKKSAQTSFYLSLNEALLRPESTSELLMLSLKELITSELEINNAIHDAWKAKAQMDRFLRNDQDDVESYLPESLDIDEAIDSLDQFFYDDNWEAKEISDSITEIHKSSDLLKFLVGGLQFESGVSPRKEEVLDIISTHIPELLKGKKRSRKFFRILQNYLNENKISLTPKQKKLIEHNIRYSRFERVFNSSPKP